jgi:hypothetical protein
MMQALSSVKDMTTELEAVKKDRDNIWNAMRPVAELIRTPADNGKTWGEFLRLVPDRFESYVWTAAKICVRSLLAQIRVLWPDAQLEKVTEEYSDQLFLQAVERAETDVDAIAEEIADQL